MLPARTRMGFGTVASKNKQHRRNGMNKKSKTNAKKPQVKVRDMKPKKDAKGGLASLKHK